MKKTFSFLVVLAMLASLLSPAVLADTEETWGGTGTEGDPYLIADADDLWKLSNDVNGGTSYSGSYFKLTADITVSDWVPIGYSSTYSFKGTFDGDGHTVTINGAVPHSSAGSYGYLGLFGYLGGNVLNTIVDGSISRSASYAYLGGIAGYFSGGTTNYIVNCVNLAALTGTNTGTTNYSGGIVAYISSNSLVYNCYNAGAVSSGYRAGGIYGGANNGQIKYCVNAGTVSGPASGGISSGAGDYGVQTECQATPQATEQSVINTWNASVSSYTGTAFWRLEGGVPYPAILCNHQWSAAPTGTIDATCTEDGYDEYTCSSCGAVKKDVQSGSALGHAYNRVTVDADCTNPGSHTDTCSRDPSHVEVTVIPATGHTPSDGGTDYPTYVAYTCAVCTEAYQVMKDARFQAMTITGGVDVSFSTDGAYEWIYTDVADEKMSGGRLQSTNQGKNNAVNASTTTITITSAIDLALSFDYAVSSEGGTYDYLRVTLKNGQGDTVFTKDLAETYSGGTGALQTAQYTDSELSAGTYTLTFSYTKDSSGQRGTDTAYVSNIVIAEASPSAPAHVCTPVYTCNGDGTHDAACTDGDCDLSNETNADCDNQPGGVCSMCGYDTRAGGKDNPSLIASAEDLAALAALVNGGQNQAGVYYKLTADLTLPGDFTPIGQYVNFSENAFAGHFDGGGHTIILNLTDNTGSNARAALFGSVVGTSGSDRAEIKNLVVKGSVTASGGSCVAGLAGYAKNADITNCGSTVTVTNTTGTYGTGYAGGVVGRGGGNVTISGCFNTGSVTAINYAGGIICDVNGTGIVVENCYNAGALKADQVGGLAALASYNDIAFVNSYATNADSYDGTAGKIGAIVGDRSTNMTFSNVYYEDGKNWLGGSYPFEGTAPTAFSDYAALLNSLGAAFKANGGGYPWLTWQQTGSADNEGGGCAHSYTDSVVPPTCETAGYTRHTCGSCGHQYDDTTVAALGHDYQNPVHNDGAQTHTLTCTRDGSHTKTEACAYDAGTVTTAPTHEAAGEMTYTCTVCGGTKTAVIPMLAFASGSGTEADPFVLGTEAELALLATLVNGGNSFSGTYFKLGADIALTGGDWTPIGNKDNSFSGTFSGNNKTISGISISDSSKDFNGLFGSVRDAVIERVIVSGSISGGSFTAGVAGYANGSVIQYCGSLASVTGDINHTYGQNEGPNDAYTGGVVGYAYNTQIIACYNRGAVTNNAAATHVRHAGGIAAYLYGSSVQNSYNTGAVTIADTTDDYAYAGGIAGYYGTCAVSYCYSAGSITGGKYTGGIGGSGNAYYLQDCKSVYLAGTAPKGLGSHGQPGGEYVDDPTYVTSVAADALKNQAYLLSSAYQTTDAGTNGGYFILNWETDTSYETVYITSVGTAAQLYEFMNNVRGGYDYDGKTVTLTADIDLAGDAGTGANSWTAIGDIRGTVFKGTFNGNGKTIENMVLLNDASGYQGLFSVNAGTIQNLTVTGEISTASSSVGAIAGKNLGTIENCVSYVNIEAYAYEYAGGIAADNAGTIRNCVNHGDISAATMGYVGGIAGHVENLGYTAYDILNFTPVIENCVNYGGVSGSRYVGGIVGGSFMSDDAGITVTAGASVKNCANTGDITSSEYAGGIIGYMGALSTNFDAMYLKDCYNTGDVYGIGDVGGIVGSANLGELTIENCYNSGAVASGTAVGVIPSVGAIAGFSKARITNSYYVLNAASGLVSLGGGSGETYARPINAQYLASGEFAAALGSAYEAGAGSPILTIER